MWSYQTTPIAQNGLQYQIFKAGRALSFADIIYKWMNLPDFPQFYTKILAESPFEAFYWEHPPLLKNKQEAVYEFVLLPADALTTVEPEPHQFQAYYQKAQQAVSFQNLGGDAHLVVPCPIEGKAYPHLAAFVRQAPAAQADEFWALVGKTYLAALGEAPRWLSTAGLGVYWLHVRIDSRPKYYKWGVYKS
jgi:hypothetical protein